MVEVVEQLEGIDRTLTGTWKAALEIALDRRGGAWGKRGAERVACEQSDHASGGKSNVQRGVGRARVGELARYQSV